MQKDVFGNVKDLKSHQLKAIKSLNTSHCNSQEVLSIPLYKKLVLASSISRRLVGVLIDRKGEIFRTIVGDSSRMYLPDVSKLRGKKDRLRGLRLIVASPRPMMRPGLGKAPQMHEDFRGDLEKLRLDCVVELDASRVDGPLVLSYLSSKRSQKASFEIFAKEETFNNIYELNISFLELLKNITDDLKQSESNLHSSKKDSALLLGIYKGSKKEGFRSMAELKELCRSAKIFVADSKIQWKEFVDPKTIIGAKSLENITLYCLAHDIELIIFDRDLSPSQLMNITDLTDLKVLDRTMLILDIFAQRAVTEEGKIQVEKAQLSYSFPRLYKKQTGLSRLTGGIGGRGPGETKLSVDRRVVKEKLARLSRRLEKIKKQRDLRRSARQKNRLPTLAIVGYTNAGKSTLLNVLSGSNIYAKDELFATLDPHSRRIRFPKEKDVIITDTVGFIHNLPKPLIEAFKATLEELNHADVLLHVVDIADENCEKHIKIVKEILHEISVNKPTILIFNKTDLVSSQTCQDFKTKYSNSVFVSAKALKNLDTLTITAYEELMKLELLNTPKSDEPVVFDGRAQKK